MIKIDELPEGFIAEASLRNIDINNHILAVETDIDKSGNFAVGYVILTEEFLHYITEDFVTIETYCTKDIQEYFSESLVSIGLLTVKTVDNGYFEVCKFSNTLVLKFSALAGIGNKLIKGETVDEKDIERNISNKCTKCGKFLPNQHMRTCPECIDRKAIISRLMVYGRKFKGRIILICVLLIMTTLLGLVGPFLSGRVLFDYVLTDNGATDIFGLELFGAIGLLLVTLILFRIVTMIFNMLYGKFIAMVAGEMVYDIRTDIFESMQKLSMSFFSNKMTGNLMTRINSDTNEIQYFFVDGLPYVITCILNILAMGSFMMAANPWLGLMCLIPPPFIFLFFRKFMPKFRKLHNNVFRRRSRMNSRMNDSFSGMRVVKAFGKESNEVDIFGKDSSKYANSAIKVDITANTIFPIVAQSMFVVEMLLYTIGGIFIINGQFTFGAMSMFLSFMFVIFGPMSSLANIVTWASYAMNAANRVFEVIDAVPDIRNCDNPVDLTDIKGDINLKNISFSYEANKPVLHNISIDVKAGEMIGIVGHSGAGKSTLTNLITRLYDVNEGEITIDGVPIKNINLDNLRSQIGMVLQDTYLFIGSIAENIAYAKPEASIEEIVTAAKAANAHDFIVKLPDGYDTVVGVGGADLSGGEKQRLAIARAILHNPKILIMDEATSALDTETEQQIQKALEVLVKGRTTFAIAHRLSTLRNADRLVVIEKGRMEELGTHQELYDLDGIYCKLYKLQQEALKIRGI